MESQKLKRFLVSSIRKFVNTPERFTDDMVSLNLFFLFSRKEDSVIPWLIHVERTLGVKLPDEEVDEFFFSSIDAMVSTILKALRKNGK